MDIRRAIALEGRDAQGYYLEASARLGLDDLAGAQSSVDKAIAISPHLGRAYILRAEIRKRRGLYEKVLEDYRTVFGRFPYLLNEEEKGQVEVLLRG